MTNRTERGFLPADIDDSPFADCILIQDDIRGHLEAVGSVCFLRELAFLESNLAVDTDDEEECMSKLALAEELRRLAFRYKQGKLAVAPAG